MQTMIDELKRRVQAAVNGVNTTHSDAFLAKYGPALIAAAELAEARDGIDSQRDRWNGLCAIFNGPGCDPDIDAKLEAEIELSDELHAREDAALAAYRAAKEKHDAK